MSSILKALKRLEEEKAKRLDAPVDIAKDILRQPQGRRRSMPWLALAITGCGVVVATIGLFLWFSSHSVRLPEHAASTEEVAQSPRHLQPAAVPLPAETSALPQDLRPEPEVVEVRMPPPPVVVEDKPVAARPGRVAKNAVAAPEKSTTSDTPAKTTPAIMSAPPFVPPPAEAPQLTVSGIVFQPEREARLAIVNDLPVMEGTLIEGSEVVEILVDRVRFTREGNLFEVEMDKER